MFTHINLYTRAFLNIFDRIFELKPKLTTGPKKELKTVIPYFGNMSNILEKLELKKDVNKNLKVCQLKNYFQFKDTVPEITF